MAKVHWKGSTLLSPVPPAMVTCSRGDEINIITVAWTGIVNSQPPKTYISIRPSRHSYDMIRESRELTQKELSEKAGVNLRTLQQYEIRAKNINRAAASTLMALSKTLGCRIEDLLETEENQVEEDE